MELQKTERLQYIDIAKAIAIFLVVLGHPRAVEDYGMVERFLYAFHMPLFFMMSGIFLKPKDHYGIQSWKNFFKKNLPVLFLQGLYNMTINVVPMAPYLIRAIVVACISILFSLFLLGILSKYISEILGRPSAGKNYEEKLMES